MLTESKWKKGTSAKAMMEWLLPQMTPRKLRLLACACCRLVWDKLGSQASRNAVEVAELFAERLRGYVDLGMANGEALIAAQEAQLSFGDASSIPFEYRLTLVASDTSDDEVRRGVPLLLRTPFTGTLLHELFGNPFRPCAVPPEWRTWHQGTVVQIAGQISKGRVWQVMPVLADALEDAGCDNVDILNHLRGSGPHTRGCWALDLILGKE